MSKTEKFLPNAVLTPEERLKRQVTDFATVEIDPNVPPKRYYRSGLEMVRMANVYLEEGQLENAYILYMKFMTFYRVCSKSYGLETIVENIVQHFTLGHVGEPTRKFCVLWGVCDPQCNLSISNLTGKKKNKDFDMLRFNISRLFLEKIRTHPQLNTVSSTDKVVNQQKLREVLPKAEQLKHQLLKKYEEEYDRYLRDQKRREDERRIQAAENEKKKRSAGTGLVNQDILVPPQPSLVLEPVPPLPDQLHYNLDLRPQGHVDPLATRPLPPDGLTLRPSVPGVDRSTKPHSLLSPTVSNRLGLRTVVVPQILHAKFILLAQRNTEKNVETCGILAGRLDHDHLVISHLIVPKQHGGADYCNMDNEEEICDYSDQRELLTLGWIHTHPTQSAFLSSVDLHTHFSYQLMMPEAIAIVCAPRYQEVKVFCLTPYHGLDFIKNCRQPGFHPHPNEPPLFMVAEHYRMDSSAPLEVVDLRR